MFLNFNLKNQLIIKKTYGLAKNLFGMSISKCFQYDMSQIDSSILSLVLFVGPYRSLDLLDHDDIKVY